MASTMDLLPTIASIVGAPLPKKNKIDGHDITSVLTTDTSPRTELLFYSARGGLNGIRIGDWKFLEITTSNSEEKTSKTKTYLFNLADDIGEANNLMEAEPGKVAQLKARMQEFDKEVTANARPVWRKPESE